MVIAVSYSLMFGDAVSPAAGWGWLAISIIALGSNVLRVVCRIETSLAGLLVGGTTMLLALLRITGAIAEVTLPIAAATVVAPLVVSMMVRRDAD